MTMKLTNYEINILMNLSTDNPWFDIVTTTEDDHLVLDIEEHKVYDLKTGLKMFNDGLGEYNFLDISSKEQKIYENLLRRLEIC